MSSHDGIGAYRHPRFLSFDLSLLYTTKDSLYPNWSYDQPRLVSIDLNIPCTSEFVISREYWSHSARCESWVLGTYLSLLP